MHVNFKVNYAVVIVPVAGNIKVPLCFGIENIFAYMKIKTPKSSLSKM